MKKTNKMENSNLTKEEYNFLKTIDTLNLTIDKAKEANAELLNQNTILKKDIEQKNISIADMKNSISSIEKVYEAEQLETQKLKADNSLLKEELEVMTIKTNDLNTTIIDKTHLMERLESEKQTNSEVVLKLDSELRLKNDLYEKLKSETQKKMEDGHLVMERAILFKINTHIDKVIHENDIAPIIGRMPNTEETIGSTTIRRKFLSGGMYKII